MQKEKVRSVTEYIARINAICKNNDDDENIIVYRGEPVVYPTPGMPGIFREDYLKRDSYFEKNILLEMKANKLSEGNNYLEIAIDAQHGGFPSRLLDVSFNSLIALYFACVSKPENKEKEKGKDSQVIIYKMKKAYCPTASNVIENYNAMLNNPMGHINEIIFEANHKLIDHIKVNSRIIAQQGALILFQGNEWMPIPSRLVETIVIDASKKGEIERQLELLFGINTSFVYPEIDYSIEKIKAKAKYIISDDFTIPNELKICYANKLEEIEDSLMRIANIGDIEVKIEEIRRLEKALEAWREDLLYFSDKYRKEINELVQQNSMEEIGKSFNQVIMKYKRMFEYYIGSIIRPCTEDLLWGDRDGK